MNDPFFTVRRRVARKVRRCPSCYMAGDRALIKPGDVYLEHKEFPGGDAGYADSAGHPVRMPECAECARQSGRGHLLETTTNEETR